MGKEDTPSSGDAAKQGTVSMLLRGVAILICICCAILTGVTAAIDSPVIVASHQWFAWVPARPQRVHLWRDPSIVRWVKQTRPDTSTALTLETMLFNKKLSSSINAARAMIAISWVMCGVSLALVIGLSAKQKRLVAVIGTMAAHGFFLFLAWVIVHGTFASWVDGNDSYCRTLCPEDKVYVHHCTAGFSVGYNAILAAAVLSLLAVVSIIAAEYTNLPAIRRALLVGAKAETGNRTEKRRLQRYRVNEGDDEELVEEETHPPTQRPPTDQHREQRATPARTTQASQRPPPSSQHRQPSPARDADGTPFPRRSTASYAGSARSAEGGRSRSPPPGPKSEWRGAPLGESLDFRNAKEVEETDSVQGDQPRFGSHAREASDVEEFDFPVKEHRSVSEVASTTTTRTAGGGAKGRSSSTPGRQGGQEPVRHVDPSISDWVEVPDENVGVLWYSESTNMYLDAERGRVYDAGEGTWYNTD